uniref:Uncharacterized protein n=1 Tax=Plectus sambesii TaxID=2011161 RepID=A0A914VHR5_9BILA
MVSGNGRPFVSGKRRATTPAANANEPNGRTTS